MRDIVFLQVMYVIVGLIMVVVTVPLIQRRIKPNPFYGFRVPKAYTNDAIWYEINAYSGKRLAISGLLSAAAGFLVPLLTGDNILLYLSIISTVLVVSLGIGLVQSFLYLNALTK